MTGIFQNYVSKTTALEEDASNTAFALEGLDPDQLGKYLGVVIGRVVEGIEDKSDPQTFLDDTVANMDPKARRALNILAMAAMYAGTTVKPQ